MEETKTPDQIQPKCYVCDTILANHELDNTDEDGEILCDNCYDERMYVCHCFDYELDCYAE